jgi:hypothetical protein
MQQWLKTSTQRLGEKEKNMNKLFVITMWVLLLAAMPAFAQTADQIGQPGNMPDNGYHQTEMLAVGKITAIDLAHGTLTLDNGTQFRLPPSFEYTSFPALGQEVQVTYGEQGGQKIAHIIDVGGTRSHAS